MNAVVGGPGGASVEEAVRQACSELAAACEFAGPADLDRYSTAIEILRGRPSPAVLDALLGSLRDHEGGGAQYELVEACEAYPAAEYIPALVRHAPRLRGVAPEWAQLLLQSALNTPACHPWLVTALGACDAATRAVVVAWVAEIAMGASKYTGLLRQLRAAGGEAAEPDGPPDTGREIG